MPQGHGEENTCVLTLHQAHNTHSLLHMRHHSAQLLCQTRYYYVICLQSSKKKRKKKQTWSNS